MNALPIIGLLIAAVPMAEPAVAQAFATGEHAVRLDHRSGAVDARYRGSVAITHRQVGAFVPGGRASTLRCAWRADLAVARDARSAAGVAATRSFGRQGVLAGSRPGWCETSGRAIAAEVAARADELHDHLRALALEDHAPLRAELDRLHADRSTG